MYIVHTHHHLSLQRDSFKSYLSQKYIPILSDHHLKTDLIQVYLVFVHERCKAYTYITIEKCLKKVSVMKIILGRKFNYVIQNVSFSINKIASNLHILIVFLGIVFESRCLFWEIFRFYNFSFIIIFSFITSLKCKR